MYTYSRDIDTKRFLDTAGLSLDYFGGVISNYPYRQLDIAETGMFVSGGMEYPQLIFMDSNYLHTDASLKNLAHQICHQWFYNIVGNNQITEAWLDEGLVSYLQEGVFLTVGEIDEKMVSDYKRLETALPDIKNKALAADLGAYTAWADYYNIQYVRGKLMFYSLNKKMGSDAFDEFLRLYYSRYSYKIAGAAELRQTAEEVYGGGLTDFFEAWTQNADLPAL
jgi:aminopeptidase N